MTPALIASCWTTAGDAAPGRGDETSSFALEDRIESAAAAGFAGFGLVYADLIRARETIGYRELRRRLEDAGLRLELEFLGDWWTSGPRRAASDAVRRDLLAAAAELGARHIKAAPELGSAPFDRDRWAQELAALADETAAAGAVVSLEFLPMFNVRSLRDAAAVVEAAAHPSAGVLLDIWHVERTNTPLSEIAALPAHLIGAVELSDAAAEPRGSLWDDTIDRRLLPGEGAFDVPGFIAAVRSTGWDGAWGVEILSAQHRARPLAEAVAAAYDAAASQFDVQFHSTYTR